LGLLTREGNVRMHDRDLGTLHQTHLATGRVYQIGIITKFRNQYHRKDHDHYRNHCVHDLFIRATGWCTGAGFLFSLFHITHLLRIE
jgi:hypothetical protein